MTDSGNNLENSQPGAMVGIAASHATSQDSSSPNMYPDPDDMPSYPWLYNRSHESLPASFGRSATLSCDEEDINQELEFIPRTRDNPDDSVIDPDFQYSENEIT